MIARAEDAFENSTARICWRRFNLLRWLDTASLMTEFEKLQDEKTICQATIGVQEKSEQNKLLSDALMGKPTAKGGNTLQKTLVCKGQKNPSVLKPLSENQQVRRGATMNGQVTRTPLKEELAENP